MDTAAMFGHFLRRLPGLIFCSYQNLPNKIKEPNMPDLATDLFFQMIQGLIQAVYLDILGVQPPPPPNILLELVIGNIKKYI